MSEDHCIITKYNLSEREKELKRTFFSKKENKIKNPNNGNNQNGTSVYNINFKDNDDMINKLIDENLNKKNPPTKAANLNTQSSIPLNLIYSQNKILERNVDVLHETQKSIHDLLIYNMRNEKQSKNLKGNEESNFKQIQFVQQIITPLYNSIEEMKKSLHQLGGNKNNNRPDINDKFEDMVNKHNSFKENTNKFSKNVELIEKNKQIIKDNAILKAIEDLKNSVGQINTEMTKMEAEFGENLKKIVQDKEKENLKNLMTKAYQAANTVNSLSGNKLKNNPVNSRSDLDYVEYKNELLDINQRKEEILSDLRFNKVFIPNFSKPKEKINFTYKLDFEDETPVKDNIQPNPNLKSYNSNKMALSRTSLTAEKDIFSNEKDRNVFLNNLNNSNQSPQVSNKKQLPQMRSLSSNSNFKSINIGDRSKDSINFYNKQYEENQNNSPIYYPNENANQDELLNDHQVENQLSNNNIYERMNKIKEKLNEEKEKDIYNRERVLSLGHMVIDSTKNSLNRSTEPTSAKYLISPKIFNSNTDDLVIKQITLAEKDIQNNKNNEILRKGITMVENTPIETKKHNILEDVILKLCVEKMITKGKQPNCELNDKATTSYSNDNYINIPKNDGNFLLNFKEKDVKSITERLLVDYLKNLIQSKKKISVPHDNKDNEIPVISIFKQENERRDKEMTDCINGLMNKFSDMEKSLAFKQAEVNNHQNEFNNLNVEDMVNKITDKVKGNMQITINLNQPPASIKNELKLELQRQSFKIEGFQKEKDIEDNIGLEVDGHSQSGYSHPFADTRRVDYEELNKDIVLPHLINLQEYDLSSSYISQSRRTHSLKKDDESAKYSDSFSEGQIPNPKTYTDIDSSYMDIISSNRKPVHDKKINRNIQFEGKNKIISGKSIDYNEPDYTLTAQQGTIEDDLKNEDEESSSISINVKKNMININNNNDLKYNNLYDSEEHRLFQKKFLAESYDKQVRYSQSSSLKFKFIKPNSSSSDELFKNPTLISFQNVASNRSDNPNSSSFKNNLLHSQSQMNYENKFNSSVTSHNSGVTAKFTKINPNELESLKERQNNLNDRLKIISRNAGTLVSDNNKNNINTITENYSDMEVTINQEQLNNFQSKIKKDYKTDESSFNVSSL